MSKKRTMGRRVLAALLALSMLCALFTLSASAEEDYSDITLESITDKFAAENLPVGDRPQVRWWLSGGYHTDETLKNAVQELYDAGYGGIELLDYEGDDSIGGDVDIYGWGTEEWYNDTVVIMETCAELGMTVSFAAGPQWQPTFPYYEEDPYYEQWGERSDTDPNSDVYNQGLVTGSAVYVSGGDTVEIDLTRFTYDPDFAQDSAWVSGSSTWSTAGYTGNGTTTFRVGQGLDSSVPFAAISPTGTNVDKTDYNVTYRNFQTMMIVEVGTEGDTTYSVADYVDYTEAEITDMVTERSDHYIFTWTPEDNGTYMLVPLWRVGTGYGTNAETTVNGDYYFVNQYLPEAADAFYDFWCTYMLTDEVQDIIDDIVAAGGSVDWFMDSMEVQSLNNNGVNWWAYDFIDRFQELFDYDPTPYLAAYFSGTRTGNDLDFTITDGSGAEISIDQFITDYDYLLMERFNAFMDRLTELFAQNKIGTRAQVYGANINTMSYAIQSVTVPETESLHFGEDPAAYKLMSGGVHLTGKEEFSSETGALAGSYIYTAQDYLKVVNQQAIAGVNRVVWHGYSTVSGPDDYTRWPGYESSMGFTQSERWANRSPLMVLDEDYQGYITRMQTFLKQGTDIADVVILAEGSVGRKTVLSDGQNLLERGYSYEFIDYQYLTTDYWAANDDGTIGLPQYQAVVLIESKLSLGAAQALLKSAEAGLPVVVVDGAATTTDSVSESDAELQKIMADLDALPNTEAVSSQAEIAGTLETLGVTPRVAYGNEQGNTDYLWSSLEVEEDYAYLLLYNQSDNLQERDISLISETYTDSDYDVTTTLAVEGTYVPYELDLWTGEVTAVQQYSHENGYTVWTATIEAESTAAYVLSGAAGQVYAESTDADAVYGTADGITALAYAGGTYSTALSDGTTVSSQITVADITPSGQWSVAIEAWSQGDKQTVSETIAAGERGNDTAYTTTEVYYETKRDVVLDTVLADDDLDYWRNLSGYTAGTDPDAVVGTGFYTTTLTLPADWSGDTDGVTLDLGYFEGAARVAVNQTGLGQSSEAWMSGDYDYFIVDAASPVVDITEALKPGENTVQIAVVSTLSNLFYAGDYGTNGTTAADGNSNRFAVETWWGGMVSDPTQNGGSPVARALLQSYGLTDITFTPYGTAQLIEASGEEPSEPTEEPSEPTEEPSVPTEEPTDPTDPTDPIVPDVEVNATDGGTISIGNVDEDGNAEVTITPDEDYALLSLLVDGVPVNPADIVDGVYVVEGIENVTTIRAIFIPDQDEDFAAKYDDVDEDDWYYEAVNLLTGLGIVEGVEANSFAPDKEITRAEFTKLMYELAGVLGVETEEIDAVSFGDVDAGHWAYGHIGWAYETELVNGYDEETFGPDDDMLRQDMAVFMQRFFEKQMGYELPGNTTKDFSDADEIDEYAEEAVEYVVRTGLMEGHANGEFGPTETAQRSHVAQVIYNYLVYSN